MAAGSRLEGTPRIARWGWALAIVVATPLGAAAQGEAPAGGEAATTASTVSPDELDAAIEAAQAQHAKYSPRSGLGAHGRAIPAAYAGALEPVAFEPAGDALEERRETPDYDGRGDDPVTAGAALLWIPRVMLFPLFLVNEYVIGWPLGLLVSSIERFKLMEWFYELTTWDDRKAGVRPVLTIQSGFSFGVGAFVFWDELAGGALDLKLGADSNFDRNVTVIAFARWWLIPERLDLNLRYNLERRDDFVFFGVGPLTEKADESRFLRNKHMGLVRLELERAESGLLGGWLSAEISQNDFKCSDSEALDVCGPDGVPGNGDDLFRIDDAQQMSNFTDGYTLFRIKLQPFLDTRGNRPTSGSGARLELLGRYGKGIGANSGDVHFYRLGGEVSLFWDIYNQRTLALRGLVEVAEPIDGGEIPFAELITAGGLENMRGFLHARFHGRSLLLLTLDYRYPIWSFIDSNIFFEVGNTFRPRFKELNLEDLRGSFGLVLRSNESRDVSLDFILAFGTTRFGAPNFKVDAVRVGFGTNWGF